MELETITKLINIASKTEPLKGKRKQNKKSKAEHMVAKHNSLPYQSKTPGKKKTATIQQYPKKKKKYARNGQLQ